VHRGGRGQGYVYELNWAGAVADQAGPGRGEVGGLAGTERPAETRMNIAPNGVLGHAADKRTVAGG